jgi:hypothetical protein
MPVKLEDLLGAMVQAQVVSARMGRVEDAECLLITAKVGDDECKYGVLPALIEKVLASGHKEGDTVVLKLPAPNKKARITWVNVY